MKPVATILILLCCINLFGQSTNDDFNTLKASKKWKLKFENSLTNNWKDHWFLDGKRAKVETNEKGMTFTAGSVERNDSCHAVLWTNKSFKGDIKIEYEYTRTDTKQKWVNILYIQATGVKPYAKDIFKWKEARTVPAMKTYYNHMNALHISYAAFNNNTGEEYVRARKYPVKPGENFNTSTEIPPAFTDTGLFLPNQTYKITVIKTDETLYFNVEGKNESRLFSWDISEIGSVKNGRIGLRHMFTRSARYADFKVFIK
ncbi:DUF1961 family protein [Flavobacteriaceae bacterium SZ-1-7]|uniref:DUF1961 family protein n=1 Tax=Tamlana sedimenti TaxID=3134126 RepID=UPI00312396A9